MPGRSRDERTPFRNRFGFRLSRLQNEALRLNFAWRLGLPAKHLYDRENRLSEADSLSATVHYFYDAFNRLIWRTQAASETRFYYDDQWRVIAEYDENNSLVAKYVYGPEIDEPVRMADSSNTKYYYHAAALGTVTEITDSSENLVERYTYDVYGEPQMWDGSGNPISSSGIGNRLLFQGRDRDPDTGLYNFRNRYYSPSLGRFAQVDAIRQLGASVNFFVFLDNSPILGIDPLGLATISDSCLKKQKLAIEDALRRLCNKAKECAKKCPHSKEAAEGVAKLCDGNYRINCLHWDNEHCKPTYTEKGVKYGCGYAPVGGNEMNLCPSSFDPKNPCGKNGPGCTMFHEALHSGGLTHGPKNPPGQKDFDAMEKCMGCQKAQ